MPQLDKKKDKALIKSLQEENLQIAERHLKKYADSAIYLGEPFGEVKDRLQKLVDKILFNL